MKSFLIVVGLLLSELCAAQLTIYKTYEDYQNKVGEVYKGFASNYGTKSLTMVCFNDNSKDRTKIKAEDIWGFDYKGQLYRIDHRFGQACMVVTCGDFCYYENGQAHIKMQNDMTGEFSYGYSEYVSMDLNSPIIHVPTMMNSDGKKDWKEFVEKNEVVQPFGACIEENKGDTRGCVQKFIGLD